MAPRKKAAPKTKAPKKAAAPKRKPAKRTRKPKKAGRRSLIHDQVLVDNVIACVERGNPIKTSAVACGVDNTTLHQWRRRGELAEETVREKHDVADEDAEGLSLEELLAAAPERDRAYIQFAHRLAQARAHSRIKVHDVIAEMAKKTSDPDPRVQRNGLTAATFLAERRDAENYGRANKLELSGNPERPVGVQVFLPELEAEE